MVDSDRHLEVEAWREYALAACGYTALTFVYAWRVVVHLGTHLAGTGGDGWQNLWNMWWFKTAILSGQNPYFTHLLHHPAGITLVGHTLNPFNCVLAVPADALFGQPAAYNLVFLFSFVASVFFMYLWVRDLGAPPLAAFLAGAVFTFSPYHFAHGQGHMQLTAMEWVPCFLWLSRRMWRAPSVRGGLLCGGALALVAFCDLYYLVSCCIIAGLSLFLAAWRDWRRFWNRSLLQAVGVAIGTFALTGGLLVFAVATAWLGGELMPGHDAVYWAADLQAFVVPNWISAWGHAFESVSGLWTGNPAENSQYVGYSVIALAVLSVRLKPTADRPWVWVGIAGLGFVLALGPRLHWGGQILQNVPMPFGVIEKILPFLRLSGAPTRWCFLTVVAVSILAGLGAGALMEGAQERRVGGLKLAWLAGIGCTVLVLLELAPRYVEVRPFEQPSFAAALAADPRPGAVYDLGGAGLALVRQMGHGRPLMGGYVSRVTYAAREFMQSTPVLRALRGEARLSADELRSGAATISLSFLIIPVSHPMRARLADLGLVQRFADQGLEVWELPLP